MARSTSSSTMRSKKAPWGSSSCISPNTANGSIVSRSTVSGWRVRRRYSFMKACRRMVRSHPFAFVPCSNWCQARYALRIVSWTRSSASAGLPVRRRATRYRLSRWTSASRSKLARLSASAAGVGVGVGAGAISCHNQPAPSRVSQWGGGVIGFARCGPQYRAPGRARSRPQPRHPGRGRALGVRRGAPGEAPRPVAHRGDATRPVRDHGAARRPGRGGARGGAAAPGRAPPGRGPGVRPRRVRGRAAARARRARRARARRDRGERDARWRRLHPVRHRLRGAAAPARRLRGRDAPRRLPRHGRRPLRVAGGAARSPAPLMPLLDGFDFPGLADALGALGADAWLLYDFRKVNPIAGRILGPTGLATRRLFVLLPRSGPAVAVAHRIELQPLADFPGDVRPYGSWRELHGHLEALVRGRTLAMEVSESDAVPYLDRVPHGVVQLLESLGARIVSSAPLVTRFAARWSAAEADGHRRAARALAEIAREELAWAGSETARGAEVREAGLQHRVLDAIGRAGLVTDHPPIAAFGPNSALPHYEPHAGGDLRLVAGQVLLLDLWAGPAPGSVVADQTWMAFAGRAPDAEVRNVWRTVRAARDAAVTLLRDRWPKPGKGEAGSVVTGAAVDDAARAVIRAAGYGEYFVHRTGHSIDRDLHGSGPHIDNFETADTRPLVSGVGFSVEPGIYLPGRFGE